MNQLFTLKGNHSPKNMQWIEKAATWEKFELDARIGLKIATAQDTLKRWHEKEGTAK